MKKIYTVRLKNNTIGTIQESAIDYQDIYDFIDEDVTVHLQDENGNPIEVYGKLDEVLSCN